MSNQISLMSLFEVGAHRGNKKSKLNPKLKSKVYGVDKSLCLIDLAQTNNDVVATSEFMYKLGLKKKQILIVGTSKHIKEYIPELASQFLGGPMPYVANRWLGGTLTNWTTIKKTLLSLKKLNDIHSNEEFYSKLARNEQLNIAKKKEKIGKLFDGLVNLKSNRPGAILVLDANVNDVAILEADKMKIPVIALANTSILTLPRDLRNVIVTNTHSLNGVKLIVDTLITSYNNGLSAGIPQQVNNEENKKTNV